jgi:hypothetical protein
MKRNGVATRGWDAVVAEFAAVGLRKRRRQKEII